MKRQTFWNYPGRPDPMYISSMIREGSSMVREGEQIIYSRSDHDGEDSRTYDYEGIFCVDDYRRALIEMQEKGESQITGNDCTLMMKCREDHVEVIFSGTPLQETSPSGRKIHGSLTTRIRLEHLLLED